MLLEPLLTLFAASAAAVPTASSEASPLPFADRYDHAFEEATLRNVPVLVLDFDSWASNDASGSVSEFYEDAAFRKAIDGAVLILASQDEHGTKRQTIDGVERNVCQTYGGTLCTDHLRMLTEISRDAKVFEKVGKDGAIISPMFVTITPAHEVLAVAHHEQHAHEVVAMVKEAQKRVGNGLARSDYVRLKRGLDEAKQLVNASDYPAAVELLEELTRIPGDYKPIATARSDLEALEPRGRELMKVAESSWSSGDFAAALTQMDDVATGFGKLAAAREAAARIATWEKSPEAKSLLANLKADRTARTLLVQGRTACRAGDAKRAATALEKLVHDFPKSRFTPRGRELLATLKPKK
jgi:hypothetical protein